SQPPRQPAPRHFLAALRPRSGHANPTTRRSQIDPLSLHGALPILTALSNPIRENGLLQPIAVRPKKAGTGYVIIAGERRWRAAQDRKSTRLNSSHVSISYAVFCLRTKSIFPSCRSISRTPLPR